MQKMDRILNLPNLLAKKSHFLFGARQSGKSFMIAQQLSNAHVINLLENDTFLWLTNKPNLLRELVFKDTKLVIIDEIQKIPMPLDEVHLLLIEKHGTRFLLTDSSAGKAKQQFVNMLGGSARSKTLHPFIKKELSCLDIDTPTLTHGEFPLD